jgi:DNA topoisomerase-1
VKSSNRIPKSLDVAMNKAVPSNGTTKGGISIRHGAMEEMDIDKPHTNGVTNGKRKSRTSLVPAKSYRESSSDDENSPLVRVDHLFSPFLSSP